MADTVFDRLAKTANRFELNGDSIRNYFIFAAPGFQGVGVPALGQHGEHQRIGTPFVDDGQHEYVDVGLAELPVCTVDEQHFLPASDDKSRHKNVICQ